MYWTVLCYHPYLVSMLFCWSAIPRSCTFSMFFLFCSCHFFGSRFMLELKFAIYHRAASLSSQASSVDVCTVLAEESLTRPGSLQTLPAHQLYFLCNNFFSLLRELCTCVHVKKKWRHNGSHSSSVSSLNRFVRLQTCKKAMSWCTAQWKCCCFVWNPSWKSHANLN